jgi:endonuclease/exonuclease/phosphatase (EEP) superfamily protein YafD
MRLAALAGVVGIAAALGFGFLGWLHPAFDSFSHLRVHLAVLLLAAVVPLAVLRYWPEAVFAVALGVGSIWTVADWYTTEAHAAGPESRPVFRLFHLNLRFDNDRPDLVLSSIGAHRPDVITLTEVSDQWREWLVILEASYPYQIICPPPSHIGGVAILSRRPFLSESEDACSDRGAFARADVDFSGRPASVVAMHLGWPWPFGQQRHLTLIERELAALGQNALVAGDLNAVPWSQTVRRVAQAGGLEVVQGVGPTWLDRRLPDAWRPRIGWQIDHVMTKGGVRVRSARTLEAVGSDHLPILMEFSIDAPPSPMQSVEFAAR